MKEKKGLEQNRGKRLYGKRREILFYISLIILSMAAFLMIGADGYVLFDDSDSYLYLEKYMEGVMPVYPLFLRANRVLFGENMYLYAVIVEQAFYAVFCLIIFINSVRRQFRLGILESYVIFLLSLLPFTTDMPAAMTTQEILTEGLAYASFYLFMTVLLKAVWKKSFYCVAILFLVTLFLTAIRSQLQILFGVCGIAFFYVMFEYRGRFFRRVNGKRSNDEKAGSKVGNGATGVILGIVGCLFISLAGIWCTGRISAAYQQILSQYIQRQNLIAAEQELQADGQEVNFNSDNMGNIVDADPVGEAGVDKQKTAVAGQYTTLIFSRGMYEADYEDYQLFADEELRELYLFLYAAVEDSGCRYAYARPGLWMWRDIAGGIGSAGIECFYAQNDYYADRPEIMLSDEYGLIRNANQKKIGIELIKAHWTRFLYHTLMMLPQAFICTVFFQIEKIYLLCHLVTLFLYVSAVALMIWAYADKKVERPYAEFMAAVLGTNVVMVLIISLVFFGQQRYLVYNFGIFYIVYFLLVIQVWKIYGKNWLKKWMDRKKS